MTTRLQLLIASVLASMLLTVSAVMAQETGGVAVASDSASAYRTVGLGAAAAFAIAFSVAGASYAVGRIGVAAMGAAAERPELLPRSILFIALAEGLAVLGFAIAMVLAQKI